MLLIFATGALQTKGLIHDWKRQTLPMCLENLLKRCTWQSLCAGAQGDNLCALMPQAANFDCIHTHRKRLLAATAMMFNNKYCQSSAAKKNAKFAHHGLMYHGHLSSHWNIKNNLPIIKYILALKPNKVSWISWSRAILCNIQPKMKWNTDKQSSVASCSDKIVTHSLEMKHEYSQNLQVFGEVVHRQLP